MRRRSFLGVGGLGLATGLAGCPWLEGSTDGESFPTPADRPEIDDGDAEDVELPPGVTDDGVENAVELAEAHEASVLETGVVRRYRQTSERYVETGHPSEWSARLLVEWMSPDGDRLAGVQQSLDYGADGSERGEFEVWEDREGGEGFFRAEDGDEPEFGWSGHEDYGWRVSRWVPGSEEIGNTLSRGSFVAADARDERTVVSLGRYQGSEEGERVFGIADETGRFEALSIREARTTGDSTVVTKRSMSFLELDDEVGEPDWIDEARAETGGEE